MRKAAELPQELRNGSFTAREARALGVAEGRRKAMDLHVPSREIRVPRGTDQELCGRIRPYIALDPLAVVSHLSAAVLHKMPLPIELEREMTLHLSRHRGCSSPRRKGVTGHRLVLGQLDVVDLAGIPVTSLARTWLDLASMSELDLADLVAAGDWLVSQHNRYLYPRMAKMPLSGLKEYIASVRNVKGLSRARHALTLIRIGVDSPPETHLRLILQEAGLPEFIPDQSVLDDTGVPLWVDLGCEEFRTAVEYYGGHHLSAAQQQSDATRSQRTADAGWRQVVLNKADLKLGPAWVVQRVSQVLSRQGWPG